MSTIQCDCGDPADYYYYSQEYLIAICNYCNKSFAGKLIVKLKNFKPISEEDYIRYKNLEMFK